MNASINTAKVTGDDLNALVGSRICHDLISPLGAISNGVELLNMSATETAPELVLIAESVESANARVRFFRVAFGGSSPGVTFPHAEAVSILKSVYKSSRTCACWLAEGEVTRGEVKLAFLLIQCIESAFPRGGKIRVTREGSEWQITGKADRLRVDHALWSRLGIRGAQSPVAAADVHFALVADAAAGIDRQVRFSQSETSLTVSF